MVKIIFLLFWMAMSMSIAQGQDLVWKEMAELPRPVAGYMGGVVHGKMLIVGGSYWEDKKKHWSDRTQMFDPQTNTWQKGTPLPDPRSDAASAVLQDKLYIFGGGAGTEVRRDALVLENGKWDTLPGAELPEPRLYAVTISSGESIYLLGGISKAGDYQNMSNAFWRWTPKSTGWEVLPPLPGPGRISHAMAEIDGEIYVFGGAASSPREVENVKDAYKFSPKMRSWTRLPDLPIANRAWWAVGLEHRALLLAGYTNDFARGVYVFDPKHGTRSAGTLPQGLADTKFFRIGNLVVGAGGESGPGIRGKWTFQAELPKNWGRKPR